jgi:sec-independent protein translocase protein TatA
VRGRPPGRAARQGTTSMGLSFSHLLIVAIIIVLLFGRGKISELMGDVAKGIKSFKKGMADDEEEAKAERQKTIEHQALVDSAPAVQAEVAKEREKHSA